MTDKSDENTTPTDPKKTRADRPHGGKTGGEREVTPDKRDVVPGSDADSSDDALGV